MAAAAGEGSSPHVGGGGRRRRNVLTRMSEVRGPMSRLEAARASAQRVSVFIRSACHMCAICRGRLLVFDKHWNLVLADVEETYIPRLALHPHLAHRSPPRRSRIPGTHWQQCEQRVAQLNINSASDGEGDIPSASSDIKPKGQTDKYRSLRRSERLKQQQQQQQQEKSDGKESPTETLSCQIRSKTFKQLFIRGDNIALISLS